MPGKNVVIIGGGLIGLCTAHALLREGHRVTIIERERLGAGAATGNAGEVTPQLVAPLASPNTVRDVALGVLTRTSYLSIDPLQLTKLARFGLGFLRASTRKSLDRGTAALAQFSNELLPALQRLESEGIDISGGGNGFLVTSSDPDDLTNMHSEFRRRAQRGWGEPPGPILDTEALRNIEPVLTPTVTGGFMLPGEFSLDPRTFVQSLIDKIERSDAVIHLGHTALRVNRDSTVVCADETGAEIHLPADHVVIAAGAWSTRILKRSGIRATPVVSGKGYSFTVPVEQMPRSVVHAIDLHCVAIPMHDELRIVGMMDFDNQPESFDARRIEVLVKAAKKLIAGADWDSRTDEWVGARPMTADGLPLLGPVEGFPGVLVASGHNMHGLSLGPVTAEILADLIAGRVPKLSDHPLDLSPFAVRR